ncbi:hypothetical protein MW871_15965 [Flavobacterium sp. I-SCBP12n]|uniref:Uncharacterized protein n=1 Tax=Flavobacterium pygoscelis TaxID=2893176 RepID=A0A9X1XV19_9FLAO|nr:hypothetical protein [Flavobacterium pygoscelis]MCK8142971.1 hypothetical protein [Flavobacterium pygoscelis]MCK8143388.1 hypothetical protein [Flavobacterium pygoscelis]
MKLIIKLFYLTFIANILISCDPSYNIDFINKTDYNAKVKINLIPKIEEYRLREISTNDSIVFNLKPKDTANIYFGIGTWSKDKIEKLSNSIDNIEIETKDVKTIYKSKKAMRKLLETDIQGLWFKTLIEIDVE